MHGCDRHGQPLHQQTPSLNVIAKNYIKIPAPSGATSPSSPAVNSNSPEPSPSICPSVRRAPQLWNSPWASSHPPPVKKKESPRHSSIRGRLSHLPGGRSLLLPRRPWKHPQRLEQPHPGQDEQPHEYGGPGGRATPPLARLPPGEHDLLGEAGPPEAAVLDRWQHGACPLCAIPSSSVCAASSRPAPARFLPCCFGEAAGCSP